MAKFNPDNHMKSIKGKPYLPVQWRLVWFREDHPDWSIITEVTDHREDKQATAKAYIKDNEGRVISTAHKTARPRKIIPDYVELAETGAIGRALAYTGYGTQFSPDILEDENGVVDSPVTKKATQGSTDAPVGKKYSTTASGKAKVSQYFAVAKNAGVEAEEAKNAVKKAYNLDSFNGVSADQLNKMINAMRKRKEKMDDVELSQEEIIEILGE